jgi:hypothetical protein
MDLEKIEVTWNTESIYAYVLSTIMSLLSMPEDLYSSATRRKVFKKRPSPSFMIFALWIQVTFCKENRYCILQAEDNSHFAVISDGEIESKSCDTLCLGAGGNLQALHDAWIALMLQARVLALSILANDGEVDVRVSSGEARKGFTEHDGSINVKLLTHSDVP